MKLKAAPTNKTEKGLNGKGTKIQFSRTSVPLW